MSDQEVRKILIEENSKSFVKFVPAQTDPKSTKLVPKKFVLSSSSNKHPIWDDCQFGDNDRFGKNDRENDAWDDWTKIKTELEKTELESLATSSDSIKNGSDDNVFDIVVSTEDIEKISDMKEYVKLMMNKCSEENTYRESERTIYTMFLTILKIENDDPGKNKKIFKSVKYIDIFIEKLNELLLDDNMCWPLEMIIEFEEIKRNRFPIS
jgi:hypothetical protein